MKKVTLLILSALLFLIPVQAEETKAEKSECPYLASLAASGEKTVSNADATCPMATKDKDGKAVCCGHSGMKSKDCKSTCRDAAMKTKDGKACGSDAAMKTKDGKACGSDAAMKTKDGKTCCAHAASKGTCPVTGAKVATLATESKTQTMCPVMNREINKKHYVDHDGKRIYLCCPSCISKVKAEPGKYIQKMEKDGIELERVDV